MNVHRMLGFGLATLLVTIGHAQAAVIWDEGIQGDLSSNGLQPTALTFAPGANTVKGEMGSGEPDYFSFVVPDGQLLSGVMINLGTSISGGSSFFAIQAGPQVTYPAGGIGSLLAFNHYSVSDIGTNFLLNSLLPAGSAGLPAGTYAVWLNETGGVVPYNFDFVITAVPEPAEAWLLLAGLSVLALARRQAQRTR